MKILVVLGVICCFMMTGCTSTGIKGIDVYTFKKERVDQAVAGNRGYLTGQAPEGVAGPRSSKRTLIGIDIEVPGEFVGSGRSAGKEAGTQPEKALVPKAGEKMEHTEEAEVWIK